MNIKIYAFKQFFQISATFFYILRILFQNSSILNSQSWNMAHFIASLISFQKIIYPYPRHPTNGENKSRVYSSTNIREDSTLADYSKSPSFHIIHHICYILKSNIVDFFFFCSQILSQKLRRSKKRNTSCAEEKNMCIVFLFYHFHPCL